jgi:hypothetical protein
MLVVAGAAILVAGYIGRDIWRAAAVAAILVVQPLWVAWRRARRGRP